MKFVHQPDGGYSCQTHLEYEQATVYFKGPFTHGAKIALMDRERRRVVGTGDCKQPQSDFPPYINATYDLTHGTADITIKVPCKIFFTAEGALLSYRMPKHVEIAPVDGGVF